MVRSSDNIFTLKGEIVEIIDRKGTGYRKIFCKPEWILLEISDSAKVKLGDPVLLEGVMEVKKIQVIRS